MFVERNYEVPSFRKPTYRLFINDMKYDPGKSGKNDEIGADPDDCAMIRTVYFRYRGISKAVFY